VATKVASAIVAYEDKRFYRHPGVDPIALTRALYLNLRHRRVVSGGSTITMQAIRLARDNPDRGYREKLIEMLWALRLELQASKSEILALYAAHAPFGGNVVGVEAASWRYFGRGPDDLSWAEASTIAVLPNSPALIHPGKNRESLKRKRDALLERLHGMGRLDDVELMVSLREPLPEEPRPLPQEAPHLLATLAARAAEGPGRFESTVALPLQRMVRGVVERHAVELRSLGIQHAAALVLDNERFDVLAYVGNVDWSVARGSGSAIDLIRRPRSTGSILKPLLYARMLDAGEVAPTSLVPDLPTQYAGFIPENYDRTFRGAVPARQALAQSLNVPAVRMLRQHGVERFYDFLENLGMTTLVRPPDDYGLTLVLGGAEGTLWDLTGMYANLAMIAKGTLSHPPTTYRAPRILLRDSVATSRPVEISIGAAWLTLDALVEVTRPGADAHWRRFASTRRIAWKTGTSFGYRDGWAIGSTARYTVGVWVGNAAGQGRPDLTGVGAAAPLMLDVFDRLDGARWFEYPEFALKSIEVCRDDGYLVSGGCATDTIAIPRGSHFEHPSTNHQLVHLDRRGRWRVDARCASPGEMSHAAWFVLPAGQEYYYRRAHAEYRPLPPLHPDCGPDVGARDADAGPLEFLYPEDGTRVYIPVDLDGRKGRVVFSIAHRDPHAAVFWHLDDRFLGVTTMFHQLAADVAPGRHTLTVVDGDGNRLRREIEVLSKERAQ
jgi:penicillin-binding protein 1C